MLKLFLISPSSILNEVTDNLTASQEIHVHAEDFGSRLRAGDLVEVYHPSREDGSMHLLLVVSYLCNYNGMKKTHFHNNRAQLSPNSIYIPPSSSSSNATAVSTATSVAASPSTASPAQE